MTHHTFDDASRANAIAARNAWVEWRQSLFSRRPPNAAFVKPNPTFLRSLFAAGYSRRPENETDARRLSQIKAWGQLR